MAVLSELEPEVKRIPKITDVYWKEEGSDEKYREILPDTPVTVYIETADYESGEPFCVKIKNSDNSYFKGHEEYLIISGNLNEQGILKIEKFQAKYEG